MSALKQLGARVRALRVAAELTAEQAAELARLDQTHWRAIEGAQTNPTLATLYGVALALNVELEDLFTDA